MRQVLIFFISIFIFSTIAQAQPQSPGKPETFYVKSYRAFCEAVVPRQCLVVKWKGQEEFRLLYDEIENFDFVSGYEYEIKVVVEKVEAPPKDTSGYRYFLKEIVARNEVWENDRSVYLFGNKWRLIAIGGEKVTFTGAYMVFNGQEETVYGNTGCNSFRGSYELDEGSLKISPLAVTKRACSDPGIRESDLLEALGAAKLIKVEPDRLYIRGVDGKMLLTFAPFE